MQFMLKPDCTRPDRQHFYYKITAILLVCMANPLKLTHHSPRLVTRCSAHTATPFEARSDCRILSPLCSNITITQFHYIPISGRCMQAFSHLSLFPAFI